VVEQDAHEFGDGQRRVRVVELDGDLVGQVAVVAVRLLEARQNVGQRAGDEEPLLHEAQALARLRRVVGYSTRVSPSAMTLSCTAPKKSPVLNSSRSKKSADEAPHRRSVLMHLPP